MASTHIRFDWAIKRLLRQKANFGILEGFLSELLHRDVAIEEILESESNKSHEADKYNRVDILAKIDNGELVIIEVQNDREHDYFHRMNYGQGKLVTEYIGEGSKYKDVKRIISVNIVYFELGQGEDYIYEGLTEFRGIHSGDILQLSRLQRKVFPEITEVHEIFARYFIIKVNHFNRDAVDTLDEWIYFLKNSEIKDEFTAKGLDQARKVMHKQKLTEAERYNYEHYIKEQRIRESEIDTAVFEAKEKLQVQLIEAQAIAEQERLEKENERAEKEKALKKEAESRKLLEGTVKAFSVLNVGIKKISALTKLSEDEIRKILSGE